MYDIFAGALRCPRCDSVCAANDTSMQTHLRGEPDGSELPVGFSFRPGDLETQNLLDSGYGLIAPTPAAGSMRLLDVWTCPSCHTEQWAAVDIAGGRIAAIEAVVMNRATFEAAHFISDVNAEYLARSLSGSPDVPAQGDAVEILRRHLP